MGLATLQRRLKTAFRDALAAGARVQADQPQGAADVPDPEFDRCRTDIVRFVNDHCVIDDSQGHGEDDGGGDLAAGGTMPFRLWPDQATLARRLPVTPLLVILKARQLGISWLVCAYALHHCLYGRGKVALLFSQGQIEANELLRRVTVLYRRLSPQFKAAAPALVKDNTSTLAWDNGSRVLSFPASPKAGRGWSASLVVMDEAAKMQWGNRLLLSVKPTVDDGGQLFILSTAEGVNGMFAAVWKKAVAGINGFVTAFLSWRARPGRDEAWRDRKIEEAADPDLVIQEFPDNPVEAFVVAGRVRFRASWINAQAPNLRDGIPEEDWPEPLRTLDVGNGTLTLYALPGEVAADSLILGGDVAEGLETGDFSAAPLLAVSDSGTRFEQVASLHGHWEPDEFAALLHALAEAYDAVIVVERNNHGHAVLTKLNALESRRIMDGHDGRPGWTTTPQTKPQMVDALAVALRDGMAVVRSAADLAEMQEYRRLGGGKTGAPEGSHDDRVMGWAVALGWQVVCGDPYIAFG